MSPTQRSLRHLRDNGFLVQVVESYNAFTKRRLDLFGFIDLLAVAESQLLGIQTTSGSNLSARRNKILGECREQARAWLSAGGRIILHGWRKLKVKRGGKAVRYVLREIEITKEDLENDERERHRDTPRD